MTFVAGTVLTAAALNSELASKSDTAPAINAQTGTTYTFVLADATAGKTITANNASASTYTVPPQSSVTFVAGALLRVTNLGAGVVTFAGGPGVTVTNTAGTLSQYQTATLVRTGSDAWTVIPAGGASGLTLVATATATASSSVSINSCFTSLYDNYKILVDFVSSAGAVPRIRLRAGGADNTAAIYKTAGRYFQFSTTAGNADSAVDNNTSFQLGGSGTSVSAQIYDVLAPALARRTQLHGTLLKDDTFWTYGGYHNTASAFDGFTFYPDSGTITTPTNGIRVYGYKNS